MISEHDKMIRKGHFMGRRFFWKPFLAAILAVILTVSAVPAVAESYSGDDLSKVTYGLTQFDELGTAEDFMQVGDRLKTFADFDDSSKTFGKFTVNSEGKASVTLTDGSANGHKSLTLDSVNTADFSGGDAADYLQFEISNPSDQVLDMFYFKFGSTANYDLQLKENINVFLYSFYDKIWHSAKTASETPLYPEAGPCLQIPAGFNGIVRIPVLGFSGGATYNDNYVLRKNKVNRLQIYVQSPGFASGTTPVITFDNFQWVICGYKGDRTVKSADNTIYKLEFNGSYPASGFYDLTLPLKCASSGVKYIQFRVDNPSPVACEMFYIKLYADGCVMKLLEGMSYTYSNLTDGTEKTYTVIDSSTVNQGGSCIQVPALSSGYIRIPLSAFSSGNTDGDQWVISNNKVYAINIYAELSDRTQWHNIVISDFCWVDDDEYFLCDGDVNGDGIADVRDLVRAKKVVSGDRALEYRAAGLDLKNDGKIAAEDIAQVRKTLLVGRETSASDETSETEEFNADAVQLTFGAMSDTHIGDENTEVSMRKTISYLNHAGNGMLDAYLFSGDITHLTGVNGSDSQIKQFKQIYEEESLEGASMLYCLGPTHDVPYDTATEEYRKLFINTFGESYYASDLETEEMLEKGMRHAQIRGYDFFTIDWDGATLGEYTSEELEWLDSAIASAAAKDPLRPIFVIMHVPGVKSVEKILSKYSQVICFTGHLHNSVAREDSINQDLGFTRVHCGGTNYYRVNGYDTFYGTPFLNMGNIYEFAQALLVQVDDCNNVRITRLDAYNGKPIGNAWIISAGKFGKYGSVRRLNAEKCAFEQDAKFKIIETEGTLSVAFDAAVSGGAGPAIYYRIDVYGLNDSGVYELAGKKAVSSRQVFYPNDIGIPDYCYTAEFTDFKYLDNYAVVVTAADCWNQSSNALVYTNGSYVYSGNSAGRVSVEKQ